ncbi:MAG: XRE family transcriptional regulator [Rhodospirillales bacterium]|nr:MAG: XRE family transcriptional regulator [Rhodospirillales bacterium]
MPDGGGRERGDLCVRPEGRHLVVHGRDALRSGRQTGGVPADVCESAECPSRRGRHQGSGAAVARLAETGWPRRRGASGKGAGTMTRTNPKRRATPLDVNAFLEEMPSGRAAYDAFLDVLDAGTLVRELRTHHGLTQARLADMAGTTQSHLSEIEHGTGKQGPTVELLSRIGRACGDPISIVRQSRIEALERDAAAAHAELDALRRELDAMRSEVTDLRRKLGAARAAGKRRASSGPVSVKLVPAGKNGR